MTVYRRILLSRRTLAHATLLPVFAKELAAQAPPSMPSVRVRKLVLSSFKKVLKPEAPESDVFGFDGQTPGPTIRVKRGEPLDLTLENKLLQPTAFHIHGYRGANSVEGIPGLGTTAIQPGETRTVRIETPDTGTYVYGPALVGSAAEQLERGLSGFFIVEETNPPVVDFDHPLALDDIRLDEKGVLSEKFGDPFDMARSGRLGNVLVSNGKPAPEVLTVKPGSRIRLRLANLANARIMPMKFENLKATVVALDGQACDPFDPLKRTVILVPGSRYDVMLDAPDNGQEGRVLVAIGAGFAILRVISEGVALPARPPVVTLPMNDLPPEIRLQNAIRVEVAITGGLARPVDPKTPPPNPQELAKRFPDKTKIWAVNNGYSNGFYGRPLFKAKRGSPVVLALTNRTDWGQVLTVHGHVFRLLHPLDDGWEPYFLDTIHLPEKAISRIAFDAVNVGKWAIRSTIPEHYDGGVFTWFEVIP